MPRPAQASWLFGALGACLLHCSLLVDDELSKVRCSQEGVIGPPACDSGQLCAEGRCQACLAFEVCDDGIDNDCNAGTSDRCPGGAGGEGMGGQGGVTGVAGE